MPRSAPEMVEAPDELRPLLRELACVVHDLGEIAPRRLSRSPEVCAGLLALKVAYAEEVGPELEAWAEAVPSVASLDEALAARPKAY